MSLREFCYTRSEVSLVGNSPSARRSLEGTAVDGEGTSWTLKVGMRMSARPGPALRGVPRPVETAAERGREDRQSKSPA